MGAMMMFLHRYMAPFVMGMCMAGATVAASIPAIMALIVAGGVCCFFSLPPGGRVIERISGVAI